MRAFCLQCRVPVRVSGRKGSTIASQRCVCGSDLVGASSKAGRELALELDAEHLAESVLSQAAADAGGAYQVEPFAVGLWARGIASRAFRLFPELRAK